jgi:DNA repair exonuclease SbcCD ATPase subunit
MWRTLQQDFSEFVAVVAKDSKELLAAALQAEEGDDDGLDEPENSNSSSSSMATSGLSATDQDLLALQRDPSTYTEAVEEADKGRWVSFMAGLDLSSKATEMARLLKENEDVARLHAKLVREHGEEENEEGAGMDAETFWSRYFFRLEELVREKRGVTLPLALAGEDDEEEDLSWGDDEDEVEEEKREKESKDKPKAKEEQSADLAAAATAAVLAAVPAEKEHVKEEQQAASTAECGSPLTTIPSLQQPEHHSDAGAAPEPVLRQEEAAALGDLNTNESTDATAAAAAAAAAVAELARLRGEIKGYKTRTQEVEAELLRWKSRCSALEGQLEEAQNNEKEAVELATDSIAELRAEQMEHQQLQQQHEELQQHHEQLELLHNQLQQQQQLQQPPQLEKSLTQVETVKGIEQEEEDGGEEEGEELEAWS